MKIAYICEFCGEVGTFDRMLGHEKVCPKNPKSETVFLEEKKRKCPYFTMSVDGDTRSFYPACKLKRDEHYDLMVCTPSKDCHLK